MSLDEIKAVFTDSYPVAVDFSQNEYDAQKVEISRLARESGYRFVGYRLARAVFTTKPTPAQQEEMS